MFPRGNNNGGVRGGFRGRGNQRGGRGACFRCGQVGHFVRDCRQNLPVADFSSPAFSTAPVHIKTESTTANEAVTSNPNTIARQNLAASAVGNAGRGLDEADERPIKRERSMSFGEDDEDAAPAKRTRGLSFEKNDEDALPIKWMHDMSLEPEEVPFRMFVDHRHPAPLFDHNTPDPAKETARRFGRAIERIKKLGIPEEWLSGDSSLAGPVDTMATSTFHGFLPRVNRPSRIGAGHLGYDNVYLQQRDGQAITSADTTRQEWTTSLDENIPVQFADGTETVRNPLKENNPAMLTACKVAIQPMREVLLEREFRSSKTKARRAGKAPVDQSPWSGESGEAHW